MYGSVKGPLLVEFYSDMDPDTMKNCASKPGHEHHTATRTEPPTPSFPQLSPCAKLTHPVPSPGYTWSWWTCNNYDRYLREEDQPTADSMKYIGQDAVYHATGTKVMGDLMEGNAVVLFAYGLSGSGKTFTVFGPDAADSPDAWFKHQEPHPLWGLYPHLAYDLFAKR